MSCFYSHFLFLLMSKGSHLANTALCSSWIVLHFCCEYVDTFSDLGIDTVISPKDLCCTDIVRYVRAMENTTGGAVQTLHYIVEGKAEALEFVATSATRHLDEPLTQVPIKPNILLSCILRGGKTIIPQGSDCIRLGDTVIVVTTAEQTIRDLGDIFAG